MSTTVELIIVTPEREVWRGHIDAVSLPTVDGQITILPKHMPLATMLKAGELIIRTAGREEPFAIGGGFLEVRPSQLVVLADTAEHVAEIDQQRVQEAVERAKKIQQEKTADQTEFTAMAAKLERDLARLRVIRKHSHHGHHGLPYEGVRKD